MPKLRVTKATIVGPPRTTGTDVDLAVAKLRAIGGAGDERLTLVHPGTPLPKERARAGPHGFYTPTKTRHAEGLLTRAFRLARSTDRVRRFHDTVAIVAVFFVPTFQRKDADNCLKLVMDAATKAGVWIDDSQVKAHAVFFELDALNPRTVIAICPYLTSLTRAPLLLETEAL